MATQTDTNFRSSSFVGNRDLDYELLAHLSDSSSIRTLQEDGITAAHAIDEDVRKVYEWAISLPEPPGPSFIAHKFPDVADHISEPEWTAEQLAETLETRRLRNTSRGLIEKLAQHCDNPDRVASLIREHELGSTGGQRLPEVKLGARLKQGIPPVRFVPTPRLGYGLIYEGCAWIVSGHMKAGKSWFMLNIARDAISAGKHVVYLDYENGADIMAERVRDFGLDHNELDRLLHYHPFPPLSLAILPSALSRIAKRYPNALVIIDSFGGFFARLDPGGKDALTLNDPKSIRRVLEPLNEAAKRDGLSIGIIDHAPKTGSESSQYATANSAAKEQVVDVVFFFANIDD